MIPKTDPERLKEKEIITSGDGSQTLYSKKYRQSYHSITGAITEKREKFVKASGAVEKAKKCADSGEVLRVMDVCFGVGYNSLCLIDELVKNKVKCEVEIVAFEKDIEIIKMMEKIKVKADMEKEYGLLKALILENLGRTDGNETETILGNEITLRLKVGDFRDEIKKINGNKNWEKRQGIPDF